MQSTPHERSAVEAAAPDWRSVARLIDHTLLRPDATASAVARLCEEAAHFRFAAVCVNPGHVALTAWELRNTPVRVAAVVGFPLGATLATAKQFEAVGAIRLGADELDMVLNIGALKAGDRRLVENDIRAVARPAHDTGVLVKVILETALLTEEEKVVACELALTAEADFVKTSTGFGGGGATVADVALMRRVVGNRAGVKASGGIRTAADLAAMVTAGADRIGTSNGVAIMRELSAPGFDQSGSERASTGY